MTSKTDFPNIPLKKKTNLLSEIKDPEGRYIILVGLLQDVETTIVSYYAPNSNPNPLFFHICSK